MISVDGSVVIQIVNFLFLVWVLNIILYRPIRQILIKRKDKFTGLEQKIETFSKDSEDKDLAYQDGLKDARVKGQTDKEALLQEAAEEERKIIAEINKKSQESLAEVQAKIAKDSEKVRESLLKEVDTYAEVISQKILGRAA
jgi:F-type H+-transporting ATPase subunit b